MRNAERFADGSQAFVPALEMERRRATGHFQAIHVRQRIEDFLGDAVGEIFVVLVRAHVHEWQHGNGFLADRVPAGAFGLDRLRGRGHQRRLARGCQHELVEAEIAQRERQQEHDHAIHAPRGLRRDGMLQRHVGIALQALRREFEHPREHQRRHEQHRHAGNHRLHRPCRCLEHRQQRCRHLRHQPRADQVQPGHADDVAAADFGEEIHGPASPGKRAVDSRAAGRLNSISVIGPFLLAHMRDEATQEHARSLIQALPGQRPNPGTAASPGPGHYGSAGGAQGPLLGERQRDVVAQVGRFDALRCERFATAEGNRRQPRDIGGMRKRRRVDQ